MKTEAQRGRVPTARRGLSGFKSPAGETRYRQAYRRTLSAWPATYAEIEVPTAFGMTHVVASGPASAPPLVLLHATGMSATVWFPNVAALSDRYRTYAVDIINEAGLSRQEALLRNPQDCAVWLSQLFDGLGADQVRLVGSSFGGWLTLNLALRSPRRVAKAALLAPASSLLPFTLPVHLLLRVKPYLPIQPSPRRVLRMFFGDFEVHPAFAAQFGLGVRYFRYANPRRSVFPLPYTDAELQAVTVPTLLLIGDQERIYGPQPALERARRLVPDIRTELVAAAGHILAMQQPDVVNRLLLEFLA